MNDVSPVCICIAMKGGACGRGTIPDPRCSRRKFPDEQSARTGLHIGREALTTPHASLLQDPLASLSWALESLTMMRSGVRKQTVHLVPVEKCVVVITNEASLSI
ncbi:hypothetical protein LshimejAT787_2000140 [Lyophyllum shimeji]|uniref:Uncharacterized protein n=1 Tax=Lyophyllum shimeji TaxID=47721 RepID=A0A9P3Q0U3_LYOSH|nr:hypothetical protein LshimejAT787_2000140 [Lyophyllum shimeji]